MASSPYIPIVVGVGDVINRSTKAQDAIEPKELMLSAIRQALYDTASTTVERLQANVDSLDVVQCWTWPYEDLPGLISKGLGINPGRQFIPNYHGGNQPAKFVDDAARRIAQGQCKIAVVCGGEALASLNACAKEKNLPPPGWTFPKQDVNGVFSPSNRDLPKGLGAIHGIGAPIQVYPLYENALRAHRNQSLYENNQESAELYANFAKVAEKNIFAWNYGRPAKSVEQIAKPSKHNRMICFPYPLLMNAFNTINIAGACLLTSTEVAREFGIPEEKWIYPLGGAGTQDDNEFWRRPNYFNSPSISRSLDAALQVCGLTNDKIDLYDFYSCFPIVPKLACKHLGLSITRPSKPITLLGGLTSFGGAGNNYSMHAITEMTRQLRKGNGQTGLVLANGGVVTYQYVICLSSAPRKHGPYPSENPLPESTTDIAIPPIEDAPEGEAFIETYTVDFNRDGKPVTGHVIGRLSNGRRFLANHGDETTLTQLASVTREAVGRRGIVKPDRRKVGHNLFTLDENAKM